MGLNFKNHLSSEHDPWKYIQYLYYMDSKGINELSGLEYFAWTKYLDGSTEFIPIGETLYLTEEIEEEAGLEQVNKKIVKLADLVDDKVKEIHDLLRKPRK